MASAAPNNVECVQELPRVTYFADELILWRLTPWFVWLARLPRFPSHLSLLLGPHAEL